MTKQEILRVQEMITMIAMYYSKTISPVLLQMYAEDLEDLDCEQVIEAYKAYRKDPRNRFFPLPGQIRDLVNPTPSVDSQAREIVGRIQEAIPRFGWARGSEAYSYIGAVGWEIVRQYGGWQALCESHGLNLDPNAFYAQARERAKDLVQFTPNQIFDQLPQREKLQIEKPKDEHSMESLLNTYQLKEIQK